MTQSIVWLASYPKSGNTWMRIFLANYLLNTSQPVPINQVHRIAMGDAIPKTYKMVGGEHLDVTDMSKTLPLRDKVLQGIVNNGAAVNLVKTHNIRRNSGPVELIPPKYTRSAIYIVRNPLDMVISYANHYSQEVDWAANVIAHPDNANAPAHDTVGEFLGNWSDHVTSWTLNPPFPVAVLRYEDMLTAPEKAFAAALKNIGVPVDKVRLKRAIEFSSFDVVSGQESEAGFIEKPAKAEKFFRSGKRDQWKTLLSEEIVAKIKTDHNDVMKRFGYL